MSGDYSRLSFDPKRDYAAVQLQQGRPLTDADWNEQAALLARRIQAGTLDTVGRAVVPRALPDGFRITLNAGELMIGRGRMYVDGLLVENHGSGASVWDTALAETYGSAPTPYTSQPYLPAATPLPSSGAWVAYLDVWQRELTHLQERSLVEKALGVDTTTRLQTVWQVKLHRAATSSTAGVTCANSLQSDEEWARLIAPPASRLSTATATVSGEPDPCLIPPSAGYKGLENQLYRIEIHQGGTAAQASFKWSRDNASVETRVARIVDATHVIVDSTGKDGVLRFSDGDWIEFIDEARELAGQPGLLRRIRVGNGVDDATRRITLDQPLPAPEFAPGVPDAARALRVRRWDQKGKVRRADGTLHVDLDAAGSSGAIKIPPAGTQLLLENGIVVSFALQPGSGRYRVGEWWVFAARAADASIELLQNAPPRGPHHHYTKLAVVNFPGAIEDCRVLWPPEAAQGECCGCTVCVTPASHADGSMTIQQAILDVQKRGGGTVCLDIGEYFLAQRLDIIDARSLRLRGQGSATVLIAPVEALCIRGCEDVRVEDLSIRMPAASPEQPPPPGLLTGIGLAPSIRRTTAARSFRISGEVQRMSHVSTLSARSPGGLRAAVVADRAAAVAAPAAPAEAPPEALVTIQSSRETQLRGLWLQARSDDGAGDAGGNAAAVSGIAVLLVDAVPELQIERCDIAAPIGIIGMQSPQTDAPRPGGISVTAKADAMLSIRANRIESSFACLLFTEDTGVMHLRIADNVLRGQSYGLLVGGTRSARLQLLGNDIRAGVGAMLGSAALLEVRDNLLRGDSDEGAAGGMLLLGLGQDSGWGMVDIHDNLIGGIRGVAIGIGGAMRGMSLHLSRNRLNGVGRGLVLSGFVATAPGQGTPEERDEEAVAQSVRIEDNEFLRLRGSDAVPGEGIAEPCALALRAIDLRVAGNILETMRGEPLVGVDADAHCEFSSNRGLRESDERWAKFPDVHLRIRTAITASNQLIGSRELALAIEPLERERRRCTVLGNITRGEIKVFGQSVPLALPDFNIIDPDL